ncbi:MAG: HAD hydrolase-like protein [Bdellovibrionota bacterium]
MKKTSSKTKLLIFDFDGVLADSYEQLLEVTKYVTQKKKIALLPPAELRKMSSQEAFKKMGISSCRALSLVKMSQKELAKRDLPSIKLGMKELVLGLDDSFILGIVSSSPEKRILDFLKKEGLDSSFEFIHASLPLWGKERVLWKYSVKYQGLNFLYVGDEERDIVAGHNAGFRVISVFWGAKDGDFLKSYRPEYIVETPERLSLLLKDFD